MPYGSIYKPSEEVSLDCNISTFSGVVSSFAVLNNVTVFGSFSGPLYLQQDVCWMKQEFVIVVDKAKCRAKLVNIAGL